MKKFILAIESSCDETAAALVDQFGSVLASKLVSQIETHRAFGGVVPEVASRAHFEQIDAVVKSLLSESGVLNDQIHAIAATMGPGLIGPLLVGVSFARGLAVALNKPFIGVHHLRGHLASVFLDNQPELLISEKLKQMTPALVLLASGGHTQVLSLNKDFDVVSLADTADDAAGECFDKAAKLMGLAYPGGPAIEKLAQQSLAGTRAKKLLSELPKPKSEKGFSFSGLKTAIRLKVEQNPEYIKDPDFCWAIQETITEIFYKAIKNLNFSIHAESYRSLVLCGGVSANQRIRSMFEDFANKRKLSLYLPPLKYCTDNAAMIAAAAWVQSSHHNLVDVQARVPLKLAPRDGSIG